MVFVVDQKKHPLMPCTPKRARLLLKRGRAVVHRVQPFVIRLKDRRVEDAALQPLALKVDPGSKTTGITLARVEQTEEGAIHHAVFLCEVSHRGEQVHAHKVRQRNARRRRRCANLRYRAPRFDNRRIPGGWLPPSLLSRVGNAVTWAHRLTRWSPARSIEVERIANLALACHGCNAAKGNQTALEFGHPEVEAQAKRPLKDAAAVNATRFKLVEALRGCGLPLGTWTGGRTRWNRARFGVEKSHALDALCVGDLAGVRPGKLRTLAIKATGRGEHCRTNWTKQGFPRGYKMRQRQVRGLKTGDRVRAVVPAKLKTAGIHVGRVQVRNSGSFSIKTREKDMDGINAMYVHLIQRGDGYEYTVA